MRNMFRHLAIALLLAPLAASAARLEAPNRPLTAEENKMGSVYRGCIGFFCLEEAPTLAWGMTVADGCTAGDALAGSGTLPGGGGVCLSVATNAREGVVVLARVENGAATLCPEAAENRFRAAPGCAELGRRPVMAASSTDSLDAGFLRFRAEGVEGARIVLTSVIAY